MIKSYSPRNHQKLINYWNSFNIRSQICDRFHETSITKHFFCHFVERASTMFEGLSLFFITFFKPFVPNSPFLYSLKTENLWCFQGVDKGWIGNKWVNSGVFRTLWWNFFVRIVNGFYLLTIEMRNCKVVELRNIYTGRYWA